ncbi:dihydropteroate synthase [Brevibacillus sp. H7]|uniref:dihydropteroate synthase n=1 Tax=Brevibacillus sp. H7 TaxID=3349138 RepID=UPI003803AB09
MKHNPYLVHARTQAEIAAEMRKIGIDQDSIRLMAPKGEAVLVHLENVSQEAAYILQREMIARGGDAAFYKTESMLDSNGSSVLLVATRQQLGDALSDLRGQQPGLENLAAEVEQLLAQRDVLHKRKELVCGSHVLPIGQRTLVMGILNVTPDSFSDGGRYADVERALTHARELVEAGADIIDIGGESTRPGAEPVELAEELDRVLPVIRALVKECPVPLSIDTYKAEVAERAVAEGAHIINDVWGAKREPRIAEVAARYGVPIILMHNRDNKDYTDFFSDMVQDLRESVEIALKAGVRPENVILDPGIGFAKSLENNLETMRRLDDIVALGYPVLLGTSRKSMIGRVLNLPIEERVEGTAATVALGVAKGCHIVRVHDVKEMKRVVTMMDAMLKGVPGNG